VKEYYGGSIPFIRSAEIDAVNTELFLTSKGMQESSAKMVKKGDILVALYGANSGEVALSKLNGAINQAILCLESKANNCFVYQYLLFKKAYFVKKYVQGGQGNLSGEIVKSFDICYPKPKEQQKIASCLTAIDDHITAQAQKLAALKSHKKSLMQQLFPSADEVVE
jgi:type I restriction enzyme S subunit